MIIDKALQTFKEKYDREAIQSVIDLSHDRSLYMSSFKGFNIQESVNQFIEYMDGYVKYRIDNNGKADVKSNKVITEHTKVFVETKLFTDNDISFSSAVGFIQEYVDGITMMIDKVNNNQSALMESISDNESTGCIVEFADAFIENLNNHFYPIMEHLLQSSGYYSRKKLRTVGTTPPSEKNFFL